MSELNTLREKIRKIDRELICLIAERVDIARQIGKQKKRDGIPLRNWEIEKTVHQHAEEVAKELGISGSFVKAIMQLLVKESRIQQEITHYSAYCGDKENILIVGGLGEMGKWFACFFQNQGHDVSIYDVEGSSSEFKSYDNLAEGLKDASCVLVATSLDEVPLMIDTITDAEFANVVFDIASLKGHLQDSIQRARAKGIHIASLHPMFGPNARTLSDKVICFCDCGDSQANQKIEYLFKDTAASIVKLSLEEHDRLISCVLGLSHLVNIVFIKVLMEGDYQYGTLKKIASTTFLSQMLTAESVIKENPSLYYAIQKLNPFKDEIYAALIDATRSITDSVTQGNGQQFVSFMEMGKQWLEGK